MRDNTVCAVVVTYNRKNLLLECLEAIRKQTRPVDAIYIIDNASADGTPEVLKENGYILELPPFNLSEPYEIEHKIGNLVDGNPINVFYVRMHENTGSAGGFYEGVKRGYERGYDWLWLMDDDGLPEKDCLNNLFNCISKFNVKIIAPMVISENLEDKFRFIASDVNGKKYENYKCKELKLRFPEFFPYGMSLFHGLLLSYEVIKQIGFPKKELFIWGEEYDLLYRAKRFYLCGTCTKAIFIHPLSKIKYVKCVFGNVPLLSDERLYYLIRNKVYLFKKHFSMKEALWFAIKQCIKFFFFSIKVCDIQKFGLVMKAVFHGITERWHKF